MTAGIEPRDAVEGEPFDGPYDRSAIAFEVDYDTTEEFAGAFHESPGQTVIYLRRSNERDRELERLSGNDCLVLRVDELLPLVHRLIDRYGRVVESTVWDLAAGGCRTCANSRRVNRRPCPTCSPRAEKRLRDRLWFRHWRND